MQVEPGNGVDFDQHRQFASNQLRRLGVPESDLDDAVQEAFIIVFRRSDSYEERGLFRLWLCSICYRVAASRRRALMRHQQRRFVGNASPHGDRTLHDIVETREVLALGQRLLNGLPAEQREVFWQYEVEERSIPEIARNLGCPVQTAYSRLHKARERMWSAGKSENQS